MNLKSHFSRTGRTFLFIFILFLIIGEHSVFSQERFRKSPPYPDPLPTFKLPSIETTFLSNGLAISVVPRENFPIIHLHLLVFAGESFSPDDLPGLSTLTAKTINKGSLNYSSSKIEEDIESIGGQFSSKTYPDYSLFSFSFLEEHLDKAIEIVSRMILQPAFLKKEVDNTKRTMYYESIRNSSNAEFVAYKLLFQILFKDHAYKKIAYNSDVIKNLNIKDLLNFFDKFYRPNNAHLVFTGNINLSTATRITSHYLNTWKSSPVENYYFFRPKPNDKLRVCFIDHPNARDATVYLGNIVFPESPQDIIGLRVFNQVLGGTPNSRLFMNLRESKGYAYYAFSNLEVFKTCCLFTIRAKVRPVTINESIKEILNDIKKITTTIIPNYELEQAKSYLIGHFPLEMETHNNLSLRVSENQAFNFGEEHWNKYYENIMIITPQKVFEIIKNSSLLSPAIIVVGDKNIIAQNLKDFDIEVYDTNGILQSSILKGEKI